MNRDKSTVRIFVDLFGQVCVRVFARAARVPHENVPSTRDLGASGIGIFRRNCFDIFSVHASGNFI